MKGKITVDDGNVFTFENVARLGLRVGLRDPQKGVDIMLEAGKILLGEILSSEEGNRLLEGTKKFASDGDVSPFFDLMKYVVNEASERATRIFEGTPLCRGEREKREFDLIVKTLALRGLTELRKEDLRGYGISLFRERDIKVLGIPVAFATMTLRETFGALDLSEILGVGKSWGLDYFA